MDEKKTEYYAAFSEGAAFGIHIIMDALKGISENEKMPEHIRFFLRGFVDTYQKEAPHERLVEGFLAAIRREEEEKETCN